MAVESRGKTLLHWNYFIALETDMDNVSRYIEFSGDNMKTYSIELTHLLLASSSEVDVVMELLCKEKREGCAPGNIVDYRKIIRDELPNFIQEKVFIPRFNLELCPWNNWEQEKTPEWWDSYNKVKHTRSIHFKKANLKNTLNSMSALLITIFYYYKEKIKEGKMKYASEKMITERLRPESKLFRLRTEYYYEDVVC